MATVPRFSRVSETDLEKLLANSISENIKHRRSPLRDFKNSKLLKNKYIEDITCPRVDMNFIFEWSTRYLTSERSERVRYRVDHEKIKFISISGHVMFCLLYKHQ